MKSKKSFARHLRQEMTDAEKLVWGRLRDRRLDGMKFRRQAPIGPYFADFACFEARLVIELDGGHHALQEGRDARRDNWLRDQGFQVLRFPDHTVLTDLERVLEVIWEALQERKCEGGDSRTESRKDS